MEFKVHLQIEAESQKLEECHGVLKGVERLCKDYLDDNLVSERDKIDSLIHDYQESVTSIKQVPIFEHLEISNVYSVTSAVKSALQSLEQFNHHSLITELKREEVARDIDSRKEDILKDIQDKKQDINEWYKDSIQRIYK